MKFVSLLGTAVEFKPAFILSEKNRPLFQKLLELLFTHFQQSPDF